MEKHETRLRLSYVGNYPGDMDIECIEICNALNSLPGIKTTGSCCGHLTESYNIFFSSTGWKGINFINRCIDRRYWKYGIFWHVCLTNTDTPTRQINFELTCPHGLPSEELHCHMLDLVNNMNYHLNHKKYMKMFMKNTDGFIFKKVKNDC